MGFLEFLGLKQAKPKPAALVEAEKCFAPEELQAIRDGYQRALKAQGMHVSQASDGMCVRWKCTSLPLDSLYLPPANTQDMASLCTMKPSMPYCMGSHQVWHLLITLQTAS
jgi:hypothetical protein